MRAQFVLLVAVAALIYSSHAESPVPEEPPQLPADPVGQGEQPLPELPVDPADHEMPLPELTVDPVDQDVLAEQEETQLPCVFPFTYKEEQYDSCTMVDSVRMWCSTAKVYNENEWRYCSMEEIFGGSKEEGEEKEVEEEEAECVLPFQYNGEEYTSCTTDGSYVGKSWCATTNNYPEDGEWKYCSPEEELLGEEKTPAAPEECVFPFIYEGVEYNECTTEGSSWGYAWCATTDNLEENPSDYMYC